MNSSTLSEHIEIYRGQFPQHTFDTILSAADVVVLPYSKGAQSGIFSQCMAMHVPVVTSDLQAFRDIINRSGGGIICKKDNDYVKAITELLDNPSKSDAIKNNIQHYINRQAGWSTCLAKTSKVELLRSLQV